MEDLSGLPLLELFRQEAETQTAALSAAVLAIEETGRSPAAIEAMMRAAHSLKGAARIVGLEPAVRVAHALEEVFVKAGQGAVTVRGEHADVLLEAIDFLASVSRADDALAAGGPWEARGDDLVGRLLAMADGKAVESPRPSAPAPAAAPAAVGAAEPALAEEPEPAPAHDPVVRVSAGSLSRLLGLVGESLVESRQLQPLVLGVASLRAAQSRLCESLAAFERRLGQDARERGGPWPSALADLRQHAGQVLEGLSRRAEQLADFARRGEHLSGRLHREVVVSRMRPLADAIHGLPRMVRDLSRKLGKQVRLEVRGETTGVDRDILDRLEAPLAHLIRNAVDHGIEAPDRRRSADKQPVGTIVLEAGHRAGMLVITVSDDGGGIDVERLRRTAVERGLVPQAVADRLSEPELLEFLFLPRFSTRQTVTEISGRGVGLDAVHGMAKACGGIVRVTTQPGRQTAFSLHLPISLSVIRAVLVAIGGEPYAFPLTRIERLLSRRADQVRTVEGRHYIDDDDGNPVGLVIAAEVLELEMPGPPGSAPLPVVVIGDRGRRYGLIVDAFLGERDLEVRPLDPRFGGVPDIAAASVLENGDPVLIVDVDDLVRSVDAILTGRRLARVEFAEPAPAATRRKKILVVDDSVTVRELERQLLQARGFAVDVAIDGADGWNAFRNGTYDLVLSDVDMPRLDGIALVSRIKTDPSLRHTPVVIMSYKDREEDRLRGLEAGANRYLTKAAFHDETFLHTIIDLIGEPTD